MAQAGRVLVFEPDEAHREALRELLAQSALSQWEYDVVETPEAVQAALTRDHPVAAIASLSPQASAESISALQEAALPTIFVSAPDPGAAVVPEPCFLRGHLSAERLASELSDKIDQHRMAGVLEALSASGVSPHRLVFTDPLTRLTNRWGLAQFLEECRSSVTGLLINCDGFAGVNEVYGHNLGDVALGEIGRRVSDGIRLGDLAGRVDQDEFMVLLPETSRGDAMRIGQKLRLAIAKTPPFSGPHAPTIKVSIGLATVPAGGEFDTLLSSCRVALGRGKRAGGDRVSFSRPLPSSDLDGLFRKILTGQGLQASCQAIVRIEGREHIGYEYFARSNIEGLEMPGDLFRLAAENGLLTALDLACLRTALSRSDEVGPTERAHVNIFASTLLNTPTDTMAKALTQGGRSSRLCLELSERQGRSDPFAVIEKVSAYRQSGVRIALDDVGFGRSSIELLLALRPDVVKLDGHFIRRASANESLRVSLQRLVKVLTALPTEVVAEGVESESQLGLVKELGCRFAQGYLFGLPG